MKHLFDRHLDLEELTCEHKNFFSSGGSTEQLCNITKTQCSYQHDFVNFFSMCYCYLDGSWVVAAIFCFLFIFMNFRFISIKFWLCLLDKHNLIFIYLLLFISYLMFQSNLICLFQISKMIFSMIIFNLV